MLVKSFTLPSTASFITLPSAHITTLNPQGHWVGNQDSRTGPSLGIEEQKEARECPSFLLGPGFQATFISVCHGRCPRPHQLSSRSQLDLLWMQFSSVVLFSSGQHYGVQSSQSHSGS